MCGVRCAGCGFVLFYTNGGKYDRSTCFGGVGAIVVGGSSVGVGMLRYAYTTFVGVAVGLLMSVAVLLLVWLL